MSTKQTLGFFTHALKSFTSSQDAFRVLCTVPRSASSPSNSPTASLSPRHPSHPVTTLIILDSSFNPPTKAHAQMASSAITHAGPNARLMLLLAVNNADKAAVPASFAQRLAMMEGFARDLHDSAGQNTEIDVAVTTMPFFHEKARVVAESGVYGSAEQVFLCGFDTLIRIFNAKYYGGGMKEALGPFFGRARVRVVMRPDDEWGGRDEQVKYVEGLEGMLGDVGGEEWARRVEMVDGVEGVVSSSMVRALVRRDGDVDALVGGEVRAWIEGEGLYRE
ncbi:cytidylyltransferase family protein [Pochonia chlamydosporia 170]|uniref:Cytidylyltransferase family protein n=1 Tax=Pochonia chlamydosporia 170 TaxID=1380566 RepID=A0A179FWV4_METCM|nr:cytidylyltransferase family protein [Pochonia chlamydosporia 170]OAQ69708.1 cytidylyltransferase family protein [Pochonia chlamydosporia 170]